MYKLRNEIDNGKLLYYAFIALVAGLVTNLSIQKFFMADAILPSLNTFSSIWLLGAALFAIIPNFINAIRVTLWTNFIKRRIGYSQSIKIVISSEIGAAITPTAVGGAPVKVAMLVQNGLKTGEAASLTALSSLEDTLLFIFAVPISYLFIAEENMARINSLLESAWMKSLPAIQWLVLAILLFVIIWFIISHFIHYKSLPFKKSVGKILVQVRKALHDFKSVFMFIGKKGKKWFALTFLLTCVQWILRYSVISMLVVGLGLSTDPFLFFFLQTVIFGLMNFIPTPGAVAGAEALSLSVYGPFVGIHMVGLVTITWRFFTYYFLLVTGILVLMTIHVFTAKKGSGFSRHASDFS